MNVLEVLAIFGAGLAAGTINAIVGSGSLITFPILLAFGFSPVVANVSNTVGLVPGSISGAYGYRKELQGQKGRLVHFGVVTTLGGLTGATLLLVLPASAFTAIVPVLIILACVLVVVQPAVARRMAERRTKPRAANGGPLLLAGLYATAIYGGYFGAAQGVLMIGIMGLALSDDLQRINAVKNVLAGLINGVAALLFIVLAHVAWRPALLLGAGSILGGQIGSRFGRRLPDAALRGVVVLVGIVAVVRLLLG
ncbi:MAG: sulfite exporter TauE/SafE family protein [Actinomycetota bacterium]